MKLIDALNLAISSDPEINQAATDDFMPIVLALYSAAGIDVNSQLADLPQSKLQVMGELTDEMREFGRMARRLVDKIKNA